MTIEQNKAIARRFFEAFEANDQADYKELLAPDFVAHQAGAPGPLNREEFLQVASTFHAAFSEQKYLVEDQIAEGDKVAQRTTWRATHSGEFQGLSPTGKQLEISGITIERIKDGQIVERWVNIDQMGMGQQLGLIPPPQPAR